jgi:AcrR family transcriptional regulator
LTPSFSATARLNNVPAALTDAERDLSRRRILGVAAKLFVEAGRDGLTMRRLAAEVGYSTMAIYRWFKNKDDIVVAVRVEGFNRLAGELEEAFDVKGTPRDRSRAVGTAYFRFARANPDFYRVLFDTPFAHKTASAGLKKAVARMNAAMKAPVDLMIDEGLIEADCHTFGRQMWAALHGAILLDNVGLLGLDATQLQAATVDALIGKHKPSRGTRRARTSRARKE